MIGARIFGGVLLAFGVIAFLATMRVGDGWQASGPRLAPAVASVLLIVLAAVFLIRPGDEELVRHIEEETAGTDWPTPALLVALLVGYALSLDVLGYALATTIFYWLSAWLLNSKQPVRDVIVAVVLAVVTSYAFSEWLNVQLPNGPWGV